jgi:hypothetical protein
MLYNRYCREHSRVLDTVCIHVYTRIEGTLLYSLSPSSLLHTRNKTSESNLSGPESQQLVQSRLQRECSQLPKVWLQIHQNVLISLFPLYFKSRSGSVYGKSTALVLDSSLESKWIEFSWVVDHNSNHWNSNGLFSTTYQNHTDVQSDGK